MSKKPKGYKAYSFMGIDFREDPNCPPGKMYFMNDNYTKFVSIDARTRWQRIIDRLQLFVLHILWPSKRNKPRFPRLYSWYYKWSRTI